MVAGDCALTTLPCSCLIWLLPMAPAGDVAGEIGNRRSRPAEGVDARGRPRLVGSLGAGECGTAKLRAVRPCVAGRDLAREIEQRCGSGRVEASTGGSTGSNDVARREVGGEREADAAPAMTPIGDVRLLAGSRGGAAPPAPGRRARDAAAIPPCRSGQVDGVLTAGSVVASALGSASMAAASGVGLPEPACRRRSQRPKRTVAASSNRPWRGFEIEAEALP